MKTVSSWISTPVAVSISFDDNHDTTSACFLVQDFFKERLSLESNNLCLERRFFITLATQVENRLIYVNSSLNILTAKHQVLNFVLFSSVPKVTIIS